MSTQNGVKIFLGVHAFDEDAKELEAAFPSTTAKAMAILNAFKSRGYKDIDTSRLYPPGNAGASEAMLGKLEASSTFNIHTKVSGVHQADRIALSIQESFDALQTDHVETMFLHVPDRKTPFKETLGAMHAACQDGKFNSYGISNYTADEVQQILEICDAKGYSKPSVYQGHYNVITRGAEEKLIPLLHKHNVAFQVYSPAAGGLFSGSKESSARWQKDSPVGMIYNFMYDKPAINDAVALIFTTAAKYGISGHAAVLRWVTYHSQLDAKYGDSIVFSVSKPAQIESSLDAFEAGPLPKGLVDVLDAVYATVKDVEPPYHQ